MKDIYRKKKSQTSVEIIVILGILLIIFLIIFVVNSDMSSLFSSRFSNDKIKMSLDDIVLSSEMVYSQGRGAKTEIFISLPSNIYSSSIENNTLLYKTYPLIDTESYHDIYRIVDFNITGSLPSSSGNYRMQLESFGGYVNVSYS